MRTLSHHRWFVIGSDNTKKSDAVFSFSLVKPLNISKFYELETLGAQARDCSSSRAAMLSNKAIDLMENSCKHVRDRYTVGLPWKKDKVLLHFREEPIAFVGTHQNCTCRLGYQKMINTSVVPLENLDPTKTPTIHAL